MTMKKLYDFVNTQDDAKKALYIKGQCRTDKEALLKMKKGETADLTTYFNSFSAKKWKRYTTLREVALCLEGKGNFSVSIEQVSAGGHMEWMTFSMEAGEFFQSFSMADLTGDILGFTLRCESDEGEITRGAWYGEFEKWEEKTIGVSITTFKRETYVRKTIATLRDFRRGRNWLQVLVVDNGSTLTPCEEDGLRIIPNRNFGGSGGFTRGMMEYVERGEADYVLLMDDDIELEPSAIERTHALLCGLKDEYKESFLAGAMLFLENPTVQYENTACFKIFRLYGKGRGYDLTSMNKLLVNEKISAPQNRYGAWWYCAIPTSRIQKIGYPLPVFIKVDDIEYGIRNGREVMSMNGIGVWHQSFEMKTSAIIYYYADRNMLILNHYAMACNKVTFLLALLGRIVKRGIQGKTRGLYPLLWALRDYNSGLEGITAIPADQKMARISEEISLPLPSDLYSALRKEIGKAIINYRQAHENFIRFRRDKLQDATFWKSFMM